MKNRWTEINHLKTKFPIGIKVTMGKWTHDNDDSRFHHYCGQQATVVGYEFEYHLLVLIEFSDGVELGVVESEIS